jgi:hypothetical protein
MAWQHVSPVFRSRESDGVATCRSGLARLVGAVSPLSGGVHEPSNPGFSWCDRPGVPGSIPMSFAAWGSSRGTGDAPGPRRTVPRGRLAGGLRGTDGTGLRHFRRFDEVRDGQQWPLRMASGHHGGVSFGRSTGRGRGGRVGSSDPPQGTRRPRRRPSARSAGNVRKGRMAERPCRLRGRNEPLKGETHGRYRRETKPEGFREEQGARRLRKPEGAAQPGEASPVQVASRYLMRRRVNQPHEGSVVRRRLVSGRRAARRNTVDHTLERSPSSREDGKVLRVPDRRVFREYLEGRFARPGPWGEKPTGRNLPET